VVVRLRLAAALLLALLPLHEAVAASFILCKRGSSKLACVIDGDTFWFENEKIRPEGYNSPEMGPPLCARRAPGAEAARDRLLALLNSRQLGVERRDIDHWGRTVAWVTLDGESLATIMLREGHGRPYIAGDAPWCD
jgi:micrococcal nuclease